MNNLKISDYDLSRLWELLRDTEVSKVFDWQGKVFLCEVERALNGENDNDL